MRISFCALGLFLLHLQNVPKSHVESRAWAASANLTCQRLDLKSPHNSKPRLRTNTVPSPTSRPEYFNIVQWVSGHQLMMID